ncbi:hypothetical protein ILUMI_23020 [Ignelater luminosus]|uniref:Uncharacterized protein n=1 Tax=Ignelater luminosus TaxID=2038154 RepID=A0A8K0FZZ9_IGNLU|nr:hypothetical protein ILUMI_23020 [Ignelater luminosus]
MQFYFKSNGVVLLKCCLLFVIFNIYLVLIQCHHQYNYSEKVLKSNSLFAIGYTPFNCTPGETFKLKCRHCICNPETFIELLCKPRVCRRKSPCKPFSSYEDGCRKCTCLATQVPFCKLDYTCSLTKQKSKKATSLPKLIENTFKETRAKKRKIRAKAVRCTVAGLCYLKNLRAKESFTYEERSKKWFR